MTALNTPLTHDFRRGLLVGTAATALLAASMAAAAFGAGMVGTTPEAAAPAAPAPVVEPYADFGQRNAPAAPIDSSNPHRNGPIEAW